MATRFRINLLIKRERHVLNEAITYLNSYAKYVIVLTQIVVLLVFFIKIILDQTVIDLKETIDQKNQIILTAQEMINNNNLLAKKLSAIATILDTNDFRYQTLKKVLQNIPESVKIKSIALSEDGLRLSGEGTNPLDIQKLQLRLSKVLNKEIQLGAIDKKIDVYLFQLEITNEKTTG